MKGLVEFREQLTDNDNLDIYGGLRTKRGDRKEKYDKLESALIDRLKNQLERELTEGCSSGDLQIIAKLAINHPYLKNIKVYEDEYNRIVTKAPVNVGYTIKNISTKTIKIYKDIRKGLEIVGKRLIEIKPNETCNITRNELGLIALGYGYKLNNGYIRSGVNLGYNLRDKDKLPYFAKAKGCEEIKVIIINEESNENNLKIRGEYCEEFKNAVINDTKQTSKSCKVRKAILDYSYNAKILKFVSVDNLDNIIKKLRVSGIKYEKLKSINFQDVVLGIANNTLYVYTEGKFRMLYNSSRYFSNTYFNAIDVSDADFTQMRKFEYMFKNCSAEIIKIPNIDIINYVNEYTTYAVDTMFYGCNHLKQVVVDGKDRSIHNEYMLCNIDIHKLLEIIKDKVKEICVNTTRFRINRYGSGIIIDINLEDVDNYDNSRYVRYRLSHSSVHNAFICSVESHNESIKYMHEYYSGAYSQNIKKFNIEYIIAHDILKLAETISNDLIEHIKEYRQVGCVVYG